MVFVDHFCKLLRSVLLFPRMRTFIPARRTFTMVVYVTPNAIPKVRVRMNAYTTFPSSDLVYIEARHLKAENVILVNLGALFIHDLSPLY